MRAVILAGGKGTRLRPLTDSRPKPLIPFMGAPFAEGLLRRLGAAGCRTASFLVGPDTRPFAPLGDIGTGLGVDVELVTEEIPLDTAGAARRLLAGRDEGPALVCNGDILTDLDLSGLVASHRRAGAVATLALTRVADTSSFGVVICDQRGRVTRFVEKPPAGTEQADTINAGTYVLESDAFAELPGDGPLSFERSVFPRLVEAGRTVVGVVSPAFWIDLGTPRRYLDGHQAVLAGRCHWPVEAGLALGGDDIAIHRTARIHPEARLGPSVVVGAGCSVGAGARLQDVVLHEGAQVGDRAEVRSSILGADVRVGARAVVGPGAVLGEGARVQPGARLP